MKNQDDQLDQLFKSLPREEADAYFTRKVSNRLNEGRKSQFGYRKLVFATAAAVAVTAILTPVFLTTKSNQEKEALLMELASIQAEYSELQEQKATLASNEQTLPILYLGGDDRTDFILDVAKLSQRSTDSKGMRAKPANYSSERDQQRDGSGQHAPSGYQGGAI